MNNVNAIRGLQNVRTMGSAHKMLISGNDKESGFLKLFMLEKEKIRLSKQQSIALLRLDTLNKQLDDIQMVISSHNKEFFNSEKTEKTHNPQNKSEYNSNEHEKSDWKIMSLGY